MKKFFTLAMMSAFALGAMAQSNGFYHVQNTLTKRYMVLVDNQGSADSSGNVDMEACNTCSDLDEVSVHPGSIFYIENIKGSAYEVKAQGASLAALQVTSCRCRLPLAATDMSFGAATVASPYILATLKTRSLVQTTST
jgi:hypothetical protein